MPVRVNAGESLENMVWIPWICLASSSTFSNTKNVPLIQEAQKKKKIMKVQLLDTLWSQSRVNVSQTSTLQLLAHMTCNSELFQFKHTGFWICTVSLMLNG